MSVLFFVVYVEKVMIMASLNISASLLLTFPLSSLLYLSFPSQLVSIEFPSLMANLH